MARTASWVYPGGDVTSPAALELLAPQQTLDAQERLGVFRELVRPRESIFRFAEVSTVLADDPSAKLDELFQRYVHRQFAQATVTD